MILSLLNFFICTNLLIVIPLIVSGLILNLFNRSTQGIIIDNFGKNTLIGLTCIGTPIHELSHLVACIIFHLKITEVKLFQPKQAKKDNTLGYVNYVFSPFSIYQVIGTFFSSIAPIIGGSLCILLCMKLIIPDVFKQITFIGKTNYNYFDTIIINIKNIFYANYSFWRIMLFILISCLISFGINISSVDIKASKFGFIVFEIIVIGISILFHYIKVDININIQNISKILISLLMVGMIFSFILLCITTLIAIIKKCLA